MRLLAACGKGNKATIVHNQMSFAFNPQWTAKAREGLVIAAEQTG